MVGGDASHDLEKHLHPQRRTRRSGGQVKSRDDGDRREKQWERRYRGRQAHPQATHPHLILKLLHQSRPHGHTHTSQRRSCRMFTYSVSH
ncbi:hypothetical protein AB1Y20_021194 [Prymnesium parvum]|uniref:Uncharacterized protein n=1 Tax=Prymnesium parvum TaxID=97485 RepID=A0AB34JHL9_PRYPA